MYGGGSVGLTAPVTIGPSMPPHRGNAAREMGKVEVLAERGLGLSSVSSPYTSPVKRR